MSPQVCIGIIRVLRVSTPIRAITICFTIFLISLFNIANNDFIVIRGSRSLLTLRSALVSDVSPVPISIVTTGRGVCRLLSPVVLQDELILDRSLESILLDGRLRAAQPLAQLARVGCRRCRGRHNLASIMVVGGSLVISRYNRC